MQKKGFTLIETLVVIALLAAISVTVGISFSNMMEKQRDSDKEKFDETIEDAACLYAEKNNIDTNTSVKIKHLIEQGLLRNNLIDPKTKKDISFYGDDCVSIIWKNNERTCNYSGKTCKEYILPYVSDINTKVNNNSVTVRITAKKGTNKINKYYFSIDNGGTFVESDSNTYTFNNLVNNTSYVIKGKVSDSEGKFSNITSTTIKIAEYKLPTITKVTATGMYTTVTVDINAKDGDGKVIEYYYSIDNGQSFIKDARSSYTFTNLAPKTTYTIKVYVKDNNGKSSAISTQNVTTNKFSVANVCKKGQNLANCLKTFANYGSELTNIYIHNSNLENGANDGSYRYAGASEITNNFVCFGHDSTDGSCPTDNLYRVIGVFDDKVKLIKYDYAQTKMLGKNGNYEKDYINLKYSFYAEIGSGKGYNDLKSIGAYSWDLDTIEWNKSLLNEINLNTNYINNFTQNWVSKIHVSTWKVGGNLTSLLINGTPLNAFKYEILEPKNTKSVVAKVGLMYISDYAYAASPSAWNRKLANFNGKGYSNPEVSKNNWMYMGLYEWTITPRTDDQNVVIAINYSGCLWPVNNYKAIAVRPAFYLETNVTYLSGMGTIDFPIIIK